jgi:16S rRNA (guanine527-N7)-methyltransferase
VRPAAASFDHQLSRLITDLATGQPTFPVPTPPQLERLAEYLALVQQYARATNLTALRGTEELAEELGGESLRLLTLGVPPVGSLVLDLGSGNGSPVIPLAIACPQADFVAVELKAKRAAFLRLAKAQLGLANLRVEEADAAQVTPGGHGLWDILTSRAFAPLPRLLPLAADLLGDHGELWGYLGAEVEELAELAPRHGFKREQVLAYRLGDKPRHVYRLLRPLT